MLGGLPTLLGLCLVMAGASFLAGMLPLSFSLSQRQLRLITALGTGVLVGTALIVIIPEGAETLYSAAEAGGHGHGHERRAVSLAGGGSNARHYVLAGHTALRMRDDIMPDQIQERQDDFDPDLIPDASDILTGPDDGNPATDTTSDNTHQEGQLPSSPANEEEETHHTADPHAWMGISLITGFILMYLIDTLPKTASSSSQPQRFQINLPNMRFSSLTGTGQNGSPPSPDPEANALHRITSSSTGSKATSTTTGLLIHALADGIALGAATTNDSAGKNLSLVIFLALMLHKAPAAFGLTTTLLSQNLSKRAVRGHLIVFSLAAPVGALLTWGFVRIFGLQSFGPTGVEGEGTEFATGVLLLFSGGTFLYVAVHGLLEQGQRHGGGGGAEGYEQVPMSIYGERHEGMNGSVGGGGKNAGGGQSLLETGVVVLGMVIPVVASWEHHH